MGSTRSTVGHGATSTALSGAVACYVGVGLGEPVAAQATDLTGPSGSEGFPAQHVGSLRVCFEVGRVDASPVAAEVVDHESVGDGPAYGLVRDAVRILAFVVDGFPSVPVGHQVAGPMPATAGRVSDVGEE